MPDQNYEEFYALEQMLSQSPRLIQSPQLYDNSTGRIYAAVMAQLAQPLSTGEPSPFSSQAPGSGHGILMGAAAYLQSLLGHQMNLLPDVTLIRILRMLGAEIESAQYPVINLTFTREPAAVRSRLPANIPLGTAVQSRYVSGLKAVVMQAGVIDGPDESIVLPARLSQLGRIPDTIRQGEFSVTTLNLAYVSGVSNDGTIVSPGRKDETLSEAVLRVREGVRTGNLGRFYTDGLFDPNSAGFLGRCVNARDYEYYAKALGATKVNVTSPLKNRLSNLSVILYPETVLSVATSTLLSLSLNHYQVDIVAAEIIPVDGTITVRVVPRLSDTQVRDLAAVAISKLINPPAGIWGDPAFERNLATVLENIDGIYAVPSLSLKRSDTGQPLSEVVPTVTQLFEVQASVVFDVIR